MKFSFCGKLDCPDWVLTQLYYISKLDLSKFELICTYVNQTILDKESLDETDLFSRLGIYDLDHDIVDFDIDDARACFGALNYIIVNVCIYNVNIKHLRNELEQLGLKSEHCDSLCKILDAGNFTVLREKVLTDQWEL